MRMALELSRHATSDAPSAAASFSVSEPVPEPTSSRIAAVPLASVANWLSDAT